ncbi:hypothetical protein FACS1894160_3710 [Bacteroidia bacterium]|nr:hypothetical protein FACS1894160_3710 [Bacteroidia bacterium]
MNKQEADELYNEKNYYYQFVHPVLYDTGEPDSILKHFERKEPQINEVFYKIARRGDKTYSLKVDALNLNLYATGVGMLTFFLKNEREDQKSPEDILAINQYGRRIFPPFIADIDLRGEIAEYLSIEGLYGDPIRYKEDFSGYTNKKSWQPSCFIRNLIGDLSETLKIEPIIDDRMFVNCWYGNDELSDKIKNGKLNIDKSCSGDFSGEDDFWYKYIYVGVTYASCQNSELRKKLTYSQTYTRWQKYGTLYGISRYSFVSISDESDYSKNKLTAVHLRTVYARMIELVIVQRASILKFSEEVTRVSSLSKNKQTDTQLVDKISSLYNEYIRFVNQIYFREVTTQDQGIELYDLMSKTLKTEEYIKDLDNEIEELYQYVSLVEDKERNRNGAMLNTIAAIFLPATLIAGLFGMNKSDDLGSFWWQLLIVIGGSLLAGIFFLRKKTQFKIK